MSRIQILPDKVANQIAAGEVIERPAAAVKELVENSLDAGATRIEVEFRNGGKSYLRIEDDGYGMTPEEALFSLKRHATSKIRDSKDLFAINSFGFRGEALPSIASVSKFTLRTRPKEAQSGTEILVNAGQVMHQKEIGMAPGTRIEVSSLFHSVPVRRKFLKTDNTEAAHISQLMRQYAVAHPEVAFTIVENGRTQFQSPVCRDLRDRVAEIWGRRIARDLIPVEREESGIHIHGLISKPGVARSTRQEMITLVNGRPVDSRALYYALIESYHSFIPKGRYPLAFLTVDVPPDAVDVNVHPSKREIRFRDEALVRGTVMETIIGVLREAVERSTPDLGQVNRVEPIQPKTPETTPQPIPVTPSPRPVASINVTPIPQAQPQPVPSRPAPVPETQRARDTNRDKPTPKIDWIPKGWLNERYMLFETSQGLIILYPPRARARVLYEQVLQSTYSEQPSSQRLLIPQPLDLPPVAAQILEAQIPLLAQVGFEVEPFGRNFYRISAYPSWLEESDVDPYFQALIDDLVGGHLKVSERQKSLTADTLARFSSRFRLARTPRQSDPAQSHTALATTLLSCQNPLTDPEGKPTFLELNHREFRERFSF